MLRTSLLGIATAGTLLLRGLACAPSAPRVANPARTTSAAATGRTTVPTPVAPLPAPVAGASNGGCTLQTASSPLAFCESFDSAKSVSTTRTGDLNPTLWGVSRTSSAVNLGQGALNNWYQSAGTGIAGCTGTVPNDVRICNGRLVESVNDDHELQTRLAMYPKQPFDIAGRTGTVGFDVSADSEGVHAAWPEFWWTDLPVPAPGGSLPSITPYARNSFGLLFANGDCGANNTGVSEMDLTTNYVHQTINFNRIGCVVKGYVGGQLNHFEIRLSATHVDVYGTDPGSTTLKLIASADLAMPMTRGVIWIEDAHYNACKINTNQCDHPFAWDNVAFDGPALYRDLTFDVQDALQPFPGGKRLGYDVPATGSSALTAPGVYTLQTPSHAYVGFNFFPVSNATVPSVRVNGGPWHATAWPFDAELFSWRTIGVEVPYCKGSGPCLNNDGVHDGNNTIEFKNSEETVVSNINIILLAASPVPTG